jgi:hypothetical protein
LRSWLGAIEGALAEARRQCADLQAEEGRLEQQHAEAQERVRAAQAALEAARCTQPLHDLHGLLQDCLTSQGRLRLLDAVFDRDGRCTAWVTDGQPDYAKSSGRTWRISEFAEARRL